MREQFVADQIDLGLADDDDEEVEIEGEDPDENREYDSFKRFLQSQGLKQSNLQTTNEKT